MAHLKRRYVHTFLSTHRVRADPPCPLARLGPVMSRWVRRISGRLPVLGAWILC